MAPKKFIVLTRSRTGSNFLISLLAAHPDIYAAGEVFAHVTNTNEQWESVFGRSDVAWAGFKIFYYHPMGKGADQTVWQLIHEDQDIAIIHLVRKNIVRSIVSRKIAEKTGVWKQTGGEDLQDKRIELSAEECIGQCELTRNWEAKARKDFENHPFLEVEYESLNVNQIFEFLGLQRHSVESNLQRQNAEPLRQLILNFDQLKKELSGTEWSSQLE